MHSTADWATWHTVGCELSPSRCILQPWPTGLQETRWLCLIPQSVHSTADWATGHTLVVTYPPVGAFYSTSRLGYRTLVGCVLSPSRCILQPRPTRLQGHSFVVYYPPVGAFYWAIGHSLVVSYPPVWCNLQPQPTGLQDNRLLCLIPQSVPSTAPADWATGHSFVVYYPPVGAFYSPWPTGLQDTRLVVYYPQVGAFCVWLGYRTLVGCVLSPSWCIL